MRMSVQGRCVDVDVGVGGEGVVLVTDRELLCVGSTFGYSGHGTIETEGFVLDHEDLGPRGQTWEGTTYHYSHGPL